VERKNEEPDWKEDKELQICNVGRDMNQIL